MNDPYEGTLGIPVENLTVEVIREKITNVDCDVSDVGFLGICSHDGEGLRTTGVVVFPAATVMDDAFALLIEMELRFAEALDRRWPDDAAEYPVTKILVLTTPVE